MSDTDVKEIFSEIAQENTGIQYITIKIPYINNLNEKKINAIVSQLKTLSKEMRKKALVTIFKEKRLSTPYNKMLGANDITFEEEFRKVVLEYPEAFCYDTIANVLVELGDVFTKKLKK